MIRFQSWSQTTIRFYTPELIARQNLLREIYKEFQKMDKNSPEYIKLSKSGRNSTKTFEKEYEYFLKEIDDYNKARKMELHEINKIITTGLAQQSVALEGNSLKLGDSVIIWDALNGKNITNLPSAKELLPYAPEQEVIELRNQLILTKMVQETPIFDEEQLKKFHIILLQDTPMEIIRGIGKVQRSGNYRLNPILAKGYPLTIYPYPLEIQALMAELFKFKTDIKDKLHPIVAASRLLVTFLHIHPFHDGNGRMGRLLFMDYLIRNNYPPVLFSSINRTEYCDMVFEAQQGDATQLYLCILETMKNFQIELIS